MWFLSFIPDSWIQLFVHMMLASSIICLAASWIFEHIFGHVTPLAIYTKPVKWVGVVLFIISLYFEGGIGVEMEWRAKVADLQAKIKIAEQQSAEANSKIETKIVEKIKLVQIKVDSNKKAINEHKEVIDSECKLNDKAIELYNNAVMNGSK